MPEIAVPITSAASGRDAAARKPPGTARASDTRIANADTASSTAISTEAVTSSGS